MLHNVTQKSSKHLLKIPVTFTLSWKIKANSFFTKKFLRHKKAKEKFIIKLHNHEIFKRISRESVCQLVWNLTLLKSFWTTITENRKSFTLSHSKNPTKISLPKSRKERNWISKINIEKNLLESKYEFEKKRKFLVLFLY